MANFVWEYRITCPPDGHQPPAMGGPVVVVRQDADFEQVCRLIDVKTGQTVADIGAKGKSDRTILPSSPHFREFAVFMEHKQPGDNRWFPNALRLGPHGPNHVYSPANPEYRDTLLMIGSEDCPHDPPQNHDYNDLVLYFMYSATIGSAGVAAVDLSEPPPR